MFRDLARFTRPQRARAAERATLALVRHAYDTVPYYRDLLSSRGLAPGDFQTLRDVLDHFPVTDSSAYRHLQMDDPSQLLSAGHSVQQLIEDRSSGSSGIPISIFRTRREDRRSAAKTLHTLVSAGLRPWHRTIAFVPPANVVERDSFLQRFGVFRRRTVEHRVPIDETVRTLERAHINACYGNRSQLVLLADRVAELGLDLTLRVLVPAAEQVDSWTRRYLHEVFKPRKYAEIYGATETGVIALKRGGDYEINYHSTLVSLDDPESTDAGLHRGRAVVTSLDQRAQPILMYRLDDVVVMRRYEELDRLRATITAIEGRHNDFLVLRDGRRISGAAVYGALEYFPFMRQFRVEQRERDRCTVLISLHDDTADHRAQVEEATRALLGTGIDYSVRFVDRIPPDPNGKTKILVSNVS